VLLVKAFQTTLQSFELYGDAILVHQHGGRKVTETSQPRSQGLSLEGGKSPGNEVEKRLSLISAIETKRHYSTASKDQNQYFF